MSKNLDSVVLQRILDGYLELEYQYQVIEELVNRESATFEDLHNSGFETSTIDEAILEHGLSETIEKNKQRKQNKHSVNTSKDIPIRTKLQWTIHSLMSKVESAIADDHTFKVATEEGLSNIENILEELLPTTGIDISEIQGLFDHMVNNMSPSPLSTLREANSLIVEFLQKNNWTFIKTKIDEESQTLSIVQQGDSKIIASKDDLSFAGTSQLINLFAVEEIPGGPMKPHSIAVNKGSNEELDEQLSLLSSKIHYWAKDSYFIEELKEELTSLLETPKPPAKSVHLTK